MLNFFSAVRSGQCWICDSPLNNHIKDPSNAGKPVSVHTIKNNFLSQINLFKKSHKIHTGCAKNLVAQIHPKSNPRCPCGKPINLARLNELPNQKSKSDIADKILGFSENHKSETRDTIKGIVVDKLHRQRPEISTMRTNTTSDTLKPTTPSQMKSQFSKLLTLKNIEKTSNFNVMKYKTKQLEHNKKICVDDTKPSENNFIRDKTIQRSRQTGTALRKITTLPIEIMGIVPLGTVLTLIGFSFLGPGIAHGIMRALLTPVKIPLSATGNIIGAIEGIVEGCTLKLANKFSHHNTIT